MKVSVLVIGVMTATKLICDLRLLRPLELTDEETPLTPETHTARLLSGPLWTLFSLRIAASLVTASILPFLVTTGTLPHPASWLVFVSVLAGELVERHLFFRAVDAPKMPGTSP